MFSNLPTELQLTILSQADSLSINRINHQWNELSQYINDRKLRSYSFDDFSISLFCVNSKQQNKKLFYKLIPTVTSASSIEFVLSDLIKSENVLPVFNNSKSSQTEITPNSHLDLSINEEQSTIKVYIQLHYKNELLKESSIRLLTTQLDQDILKVSGDLIIEVNSVKEALNENDQGGYQFEDVWDYSLNLKKISMKKTKFVNLVENKHGVMMIRC